MAGDTSLLAPALYVPSLCHLKMAEKKWAAVKCKIQHPLDHWCFLIGALVWSPPFQKQLFFFKIVILTYISDMELNKIDSNFCVCHDNDYWLERPKINTVFQKWIGWVNSFYAVIPSPRALSLPLCTDFISEGLSPSSCFMLRRKFIFFLSGCWSVWAVAPTQYQAPARPPSPPVFWLIRRTNLTYAQRVGKCCPLQMQAVCSAVFQGINQGINSSNLAFFPLLE